MTTPEQEPKPDAGTVVDEAPRIDSATESEHAENDGQSAADAADGGAGRAAEFGADGDAESDQAADAELIGEPDADAADRDGEIEPEAAVETADPDAGASVADGDVAPVPADGDVGLEAAVETADLDAGPSVADGDVAPAPADRDEIGPEAAVDAIESEPADPDAALASAGGDAESGVAAGDGADALATDPIGADGEPDTASGEPGAEESGEVAITASDLPDLTEDATLHAALEALLLIVDAPAEDELLADTLDQPVKRIREALVAMSAQYLEQDRGIDLRNVGGGWRFYTRDRFAPFVEKLLLDGQRAKLTRAALESLAVIAYRQPVTRSRVAAVRGVNVDGVIRTLLARGLIEETGTDKDTGGILYRTTELFLERLGLSSLEDLPPIAPLLPEVDAIDDV